MSNYFISDTHFADKASLSRENRPFNNTDEFDTYVINNINSMVDKNDILWILGDFINYNGDEKYTWLKSIKYASLINCKTILIMGNNEERLMNEKFDGNFNKFKNYLISDCGFFDVRYESFLDINDRKFYLNHYPSKHKDNYINLFGHLHRICFYKPFGINMSCDINHFYPFSEKELFSVLERKETYWDIDIDVQS